MPMLETITAEELVNTPLSSPRWVVEDLIGVGVTLLVGSPKVGKSWLALRLAECVSRGEPLWGFATCGGTVLDLELEDNLPRIQQRLFRLADECSDTFHLCVNAPSLADGLLDEIAAFVIAHPGTKLVIVDTLQTVRQSSQRSAYASDYRDVRDFKGFADQFGIAVVLVHHQRKMDDPDPLNTVSGTNGITGAADTTMVLDRKRGEKRAILKVTGRDVIERELALEFNDC
jgi:RecA-family ATPase